MMNLLRFVSYIKLIPKCAKYWLHGCHEQSRQIQCILDFAPRWASIFVL